MALTEICINGDHEQFLGWRLAGGFKNGASPAISY